MYNNVWPSLNIIHQNKSLVFVVWVYSSYYRYSLFICPKCTPPLYVRLNKRVVNVKEILCDTIVECVCGGGGGACVCVSLRWCFIEPV